MAIQNLGTIHLTAAQQTAIDGALNIIITNLTGVSQSLSDADRKRYGSINEQNKLVVNKVNDYHMEQPALQSPDVDWVEFDLDYADRTYADSRLDIMSTAARMMSDFKIVHDYDNYENALADYQYTQYKVHSDTPGYTTKLADLKQFFPHTSHLHIKLTPETPAQGSAEEAKAK